MPGNKQSASQDLNLLISKGRNRIPWDALMSCVGIWPDIGEFSKNRSDSFSTKIRNIFTESTDTALHEGSQEDSVSAGLEFSRECTCLRTDPRMVGWTGCGNERDLSR
jgi:hypothetical protein